MIINIFTTSAFKALITIVDAFLVLLDLYAMGADTSNPVSYTHLRAHET